MASLIDIPASAMLGDQDAQLVAGDMAAAEQEFLGRAVLGFGDTDEAAAVTQYYLMPSQYTGTGLQATLRLFAASDTTNDIAFDVFVEAVTPNADTLDLEAAASWDSANSGTRSLGGTTAGDALTLVVPLTNAGAAAAGDLVRFGVRRDCDSGDDDASGDIYLAGLSIEDDG